LPLPDPQGRNPKKRPYIVITADIDPVKPINIVALTSTFDFPLPDDHVEIPYGRGCHTKLTRPGAAICSWHYRIPFDWITEGKGFVDGRRIDAITEKVLQCAPQPVRVFIEADRLSLQQSETT
jgi:hypothetical protein